MKKEQRYGEQGFTLIEIIIVLVLLGILAATAVPKYFDLVTTANSRAADSAVAEVQAQINLRFADGILTGGSCTAGKTAIIGNYSGKSVELGQYNVTVTEFTNTTTTTTATVKKGTESINSTSGETWTLQIPVCN